MTDLQQFVHSTVMGWPLWKVCQLEMPVRIARGILSDWRKHNNDPRSVEELLRIKGGAHQGVPAR